MQTIEKIQEMLKNIDIDIDISDITGASIDELDVTIEEYIGEQEIIYYANAMDYLREHDASLTISLSLAVEQGYTINTLNSEVLATILMQDNMHEDYRNIRGEIEELLK